MVADMHCHLCCSHAWSAKADRGYSCTQAFVRCIMLASKACTTLGLPFNSCASPSQLTAGVLQGTAAQKAQGPEKVGVVRSSVIWQLRCPASSGASTANVRTPPRASPLMLGTQISAACWPQRKRQQDLQPAPSWGLACVNFRVLLLTA